MRHHPDLAKTLGLDGDARVLVFATEAGPAQSAASDASARLTEARES
jgi:hypothetical protein